MRSAGPSRSRCAWTPSARATGAPPRRWYAPSTSGRERSSSASICCVRFTDSPRTTGTLDGQDCLGRHKEATNSALSAAENDLVDRNGACGVFHHMRFLILPFVAAAAVVGASHDVAVQSARPLVVLVHGRGQLGQDTATLRREWKRDLDSSLSLVGMPRVRDEDVRLAWYADVLDPESDSVCTTAVSSNPDSLSFGDLARGFLGFLASAVPKDESIE